MPCSPSYLLIDMTLWYTPGIYEAAVKTFPTHTPTTHTHTTTTAINDSSSSSSTPDWGRGGGGYDEYDCALTSVPCTSNITAALVAFEDNLFYWFDLVVLNFLLTTIIVLGFIGNVANIVIFSTTSIASGSTNSLLLAVAVSDLVNIVVIGLLVVASSLCYVDEATAITFFNVTFPYVGTTARFISLLSLDYVTVISMQRAAAVLFPFKTTIIFSRRITDIVIATLAITCVGTVTFTSCSFIPRWVYHPYFNETISLGYTYFIDYLVIFEIQTHYLNARNAFDLVLLFVTGFLTGVKLQSQALARASLKKDSNSKPSTESKMSTREAGVVKMSLTVCFATFVFYSIAITGNGIFQLHMAEIFKSPLPVLNLFCMVVVMGMGSSFNFFLYLVMSSKFRSAFRIYFMFGKKENDT